MSGLGNGLLAVGCWGGRFAPEHDVEILNHRERRGHRKSDVFFLCDSLRFLRFFFALATETHYLLLPPPFCLIRTPVQLSRPVL